MCDMSEMRGTRVLHGWCVHAVSVPCVCDEIIVWVCHVWVCVPCLGVYDVCACVLREYVTCV